VWDKPAKPSEVHFSIGRIPFSMSVTTNFDRLLEAADQIPKTILTWRDPEAILQAIQFRWPIVVKTHGSIGNGPTIILGGRQYRGLMYSNPRFQNLLKWIFMTRTFLFVGSSLNDPDLTHLFHEAISEYPATFGPHYAILPITEASQLRVRNLYESLRIRVIPISIWNADYEKEVDKQVEKKRGELTKEPLEDSLPENEKKKRLEGREQLLNDFRTEARAIHVSSKKWLSEGIARELTALSGEVAKQIVASAPPALPSSDDKQFFLMNALDELLERAIDSTGSFRGDVCLSDDDLGGSRMSGTLKYKISKGPTDIEVIRGKEVAANSVCGIAYYKSRSDQGVYIRDVQTPAIDIRCKLEHYGQIDYLAGHTEVRSELALPIDADGVRVGVLNLESLVPDAYTKDHVEAAKWFTDKAGRMFGAVNERERRARVLALEEDNWFESVLNLFDRLWKLRYTASTPSPRLYCAVYKVDYRKGCLVSSEKANNLDEQQNKMEYGFDETSMATAVFRDRAPYFYSDMKKAINEGKVSRKHLKIALPAGSILGFPVYIRGHIAGVVLVWGREMHVSDLYLFSRASHLLANTKRQDDMLGLIHQLIDIFHADPADKSNIDKSVSIQGLSARRNAVGALIDEFLGFLVYQFLSKLPHEMERSKNNLPVPKRARLWVLNDEDDEIVPKDIGLPTFLVTCEAKRATTDAENNWWPKFTTPYSTDIEKRKRDGYLMFTRPESRATGERNVPNSPDTAIMQINKDDKPLAILAPNNRYLNFLLSRYPADPYTRVQYPQIFGPDPKADWLGQHPRQPWYVAPLLASADVDGKVENKFDCIGYLTLDEGYSQRLSDIGHWRCTDELKLTDKQFEQQFKELFDCKKFGVIIPDRKFQALKREADHSLVNEMMHLIDFFVGCLTTLSPSMEFVEKLRSTGVSGYVG
jgi:hypothetical protein